jgi:hypothetical protein
LSTAPFLPRVRPTRKKNPPEKAPLYPSFPGRDSIAHEEWSSGVMEYWNTGKMT